MIYAVIWFFFARETLDKTINQESTSLLAEQAAAEKEAAQSNGYLRVFADKPYMAFVALVAIGLFADPARRSEPRRQVAHGALALATFYAHLIPFGVLGLGVLTTLSPPSGRLRALGAAGPDCRQLRRQASHHGGADFDP